MFSNRSNLKFAVSLAGMILALVALLLNHLNIFGMAASNLNQVVYGEGGRVYYRFTQSGQTCPAYVQIVDCGLDFQNGGYFSLVNTYVGYPCNTPDWMTSAVFYGQALLTNTFPVVSGDGIMPRLQLLSICSARATAGTTANKTNLYATFAPQLQRFHPYP